MLIKIIRVLTWDLLSCAQLSEARLALPASADGFESRRSLLLYDLPTEHMQLKPLPRLRFFGRHQVHGCGASMNIRPHQAFQYRKSVRPQIWRGDAPSPALPMQPGIPPPRLIPVTVLEDCERLARRRSPAHLRY